MKYYYTDGNNNRYTLSENQLIFTPITKEESSSGNYDGGSPWTKELSKLELIKLIDVLERAIWSQSDQTNARGKGSSQLRKPGNEINVNLTFNSPSQKSIQTMLSGFHNQTN